MYTDQVHDDGQGFESGPSYEEPKKMSKLGCLVSAIIGTILLFFVVLGVIRIIQTWGQVPKELQTPQFHAPK